MLEQVGRYHLEGRLGDGAMADVYRAFDPQIARPLAIKLLKSEFLTERQYADRFLREAKAAGALSHPNIVTVYDVGEADGVPYIVMELLDGQPLDQLLREGPIDSVTTLRIGIQLADALAFAHAQKVIHRDIKPSNIIVARDGHSVKLLDFGIARVGDMLFDSESVRTQVGQVLGTPRYMSPEQAMGGEIDGRSDLFSVGAVLYEMLSGKRAFQGNSSVSLAMEIVQRDPAPLATVAPATPGGVQFIVGKLLAKAPSQRFADGRQLAEAMRKELAVLTGGAETPVRRSYLPIQIRLPIILAVTTTLLLIAAIGTVLARQYDAMQDVALASGNAIASFVASNAALRAVENATLPPAQQDWVPVEAFVRRASDDPTVRNIIVVGADGVVRAATTPALIGQAYAAARGGKVIEQHDGTVASVAAGGQGPSTFRFVRPIRYAGRSFGQVDVEVSKAPLDAAARLAELLLATLGVVTVGGVALTSYFGARALAQPLRRVTAALHEVAGGNIDFRISHKRLDEFGELYDGFNAAIGAVQDRVQAGAHAPMPVAPTAAMPAAAAVAAVAPAPAVEQSPAVEAPPAHFAPEEIDEAVFDLADIDLPAPAAPPALPADGHEPVPPATVHEPLPTPPDDADDDDMEGTLIGPSRR